MDNQQPKKSQRASKACDACHLGKRKCYWRPPSCVDCIRLGLECTFNRDGQVQAKKPESHIEVVLEPSASIVPGTDQVSQPDSADEPNASNSLALQQVMNNNIEEMVVFKYFALENHTFPIFNFAPFHHQLRIHHAATQAEEDPAWLAGLQGVLAACGPHLQLAEAELNEATAKQHLQNALSHIHLIVVRKPTTQAIQALTCIVACSRLPIFSDIQSTQLLAVAIRMAFTLHLHRLDEVMGISADGRLERIRLFWCLYILDKEMALTDDAPPLIDDEDIRVIEPKMFSIDELGLEKNLDETITLNLFVARQRLAQVASRIWKGLLTFKAQHQPKRAKLEITMQLNEDLARWKTEWFQYGDSSDVDTRWSKRTIEKLANLQCQYFMCLLKRNIDRPCKATEMRDVLNAGRELDHQALNLNCVLAARDTLYLMRAVGKGGLSYIFAAMTYTVPAIVMMLTHLCTASQTELQRKSDMEIIQAWLDIQGYLIERMEQPELREEHLACQEMYRQAKARAQAESDRFFKAMDWSQEESEFI